MASTSLCADGPAFDLVGPKVDVHVKRGAVTLPISETPNLLPGDRLWIHPDLPPSQSTHFVLVIAFLRGATNPPPPEWFTRVETWNPDVREEGVFVTVPSGAQQALLFLAPETGGDFNTLRGAVRGRPGAFVRAAQDLQVASWERLRLEAYLADVKTTSQTNPKALKVHAEMAARSLGIKVQEHCFDRPPEQQASCLTQNSEGLVLDDANAQSLVGQLTSGSTADLMNQLTYTSMAGGGMYSAYVGAVVDTARILSSLHTAHFQYIPALALPTDDTLNLRLNVPPSFRNPKSVVVVALPPMGPAKPLPVYAVNPADTYCASKPNLVLPVGGAPLVFATPLAHDISLRIDNIGTHATPLDLPLKTDATLGGLELLHPAPQLPPGELTATVHGKWGFDDWEGPSFHLFSPQPDRWTLAPGDQSALVVGRQDTLHFQGESSLCVEGIEAQTGAGHPERLVWKSLAPDTLEAEVPLKNVPPGPVTLLISEYGLSKPDRLVLKAYGEAASLGRLALSAGDKDAVLKGTRLDEVAKATLNGITLTPSILSRVQDSDQLTLKAESSTAALQPGLAYVAHVELRDGRQLTAPVTVDPPRPQITLISKGVQDANTATPSPVQFGSPDDLPLTGRLVFFLRSTVPFTFPRDEKIELAAADQGFHTMLSLSDGSLILADSRTAVGNIEPMARFGASAFGPVRVRAVSASGETGDWVSLGTLVRVPEFKDLRCPRSAARPCILSGSSLFLADSIASAQDFDNSTEIPMGFTGTQLTVPHPASGTLYLKLRDDPSTVQTLMLPVTPLPQSATMQPRPAVTPAPEPAATETPSDEPDESPAASQTTAPATSSTTPPAAAPARPPDAAPPASASPQPVH